MSSVEKRGIRQLEFYSSGSKEERVFGGGSKDMLPVVRLCPLSTFIVQ